MTTDPTDPTPENDAETPPVHAWADGFGVWHVRTGRTIASPLIAARRALRDELAAREGTRLARDVWMHPVRVPELDDADTIVYREYDRDTDPTPQGTGKRS